ncbi:glioma pathogenesis-related protein 1-like isoform X2 [Carettochelys insculpta]|uniref:glioma pathogenesis-related protein 1-like isoform X2 n=1 Tax=Carettochelys insculpta TaxID=44489 RepID=UPI003EBDB414
MSVLYRPQTRRTGTAHGAAHANPAPQRCCWEPRRGARSTSPTWDSALAKSAKAWAKRCHFDHNIYLKVQGKVHPDFTPVGENIWTGSLSLFSVNAAIRKWYNEVTDYDFKTHSCTRICGHYTQVVWAESYKVGCAVQFCPRVTGTNGITKAAHFICNYGPAGNYPRRPYTQGAACSDCNGEKCVNKLCENPEREKLRSYSSWYPDWDTHPHPGPSQAPAPRPDDAPRPRPPSAPQPSSPHSSCDQYCITVLIVRLLFVLLIFGAALLVQWQYPQIFIYD